MLILLRWEMNKKKTPIFNIEKYLLSIYYMLVTEDIGVNKMKPFPSWIPSKGTAVVNIYWGLAMRQALF